MSGRLFAVIPAAGHSRRMGRPKLLLPLGGKTVLQRLLAALDLPAIVERFVVVRPNDAPLIEAAHAAGATTVIPDTEPPEMRVSIEHALRAIEERHHPDSDDGWILIPADHPTLDAAVTNQLVARWQHARPAILIPTHAGRRGHPTVFRWDLVDDVFRLPPDAGLNRLVKERASDVVELEIQEASILVDLDTAEDYAALCRRFEPHSSDATDSTS